MKINLNVDTKNMTKEERLEVQSQLQSALDQLKCEIRNMTKAEHVHFGAVGPDIFFGIPFDFEIMSKKELQSSKKAACRLRANFQLQLNPYTPNNNISKDFFGKTFDFSEMSDKELRQGLDETKALLKKITEKLMIVEKLEGTSSHKDPH